MLGSQNMTDVESIWEVVLKFLSEPVGAMNKSYEHLPTSSIFLTHNNHSLSSDAHLHQWLMFLHHCFQKMLPDALWLCVSHTVSCSPCRSKGPMGPGPAPLELCSSHSGLPVLLCESDAIPTGSVCCAPLDSFCFCPSVISLAILSKLCALQGFFSSQLYLPA